MFTKVGETKSKTERTIGDNTKHKLLSVDKANVVDPKTKKHSVTKITNVADNPANKNYVRRKIITKGALIETEKGKAKVTSRPWQSKVVNAVLVNE